MSSFGVVAVAVDAYPDPPGRLPSSASAARLVAILGGDHGGAVVASEVVATEQGLVDVIRRWASDAGRPASSVLYLVGHGRGDGLDHEFLVPEGDQVVGFRTVRLAQDLQRDWLRRQTDPSSWALLVLDCCDSAVGVDNLVAELASKSPKKPKRLGLWPVAPGGAARTGAFVDAFEQALGTFTENDERIPFDEVFRRIRPVLGDLQPEGFLPDEAALTRPRPAAPVVLPLDVHAELRRVIAGQPPEIRSHFLTKAQGGEAGEVAWHFSGREQEIDELREWLEGGRGLKVVTGEAGSGKSALLGHLVVASDPELVSLYERSGLAPGMAGAPRPPDHAFDAVVHLTGKTAQEAIDDVADQLGLTSLGDDVGASERALHARIQAFAARVRPGTTLLADALDESQDPHAIAGFLRQVSGGPLRVVVGTRRSLSEGPDQPADPARRELLDALDVDDADVVVVERDREAVYAYAKRRLAREDSPYAARPELAAKVARLIARLDQPFLFARLATAELLARPAYDIDDPELAELLGHGHRGVFAAALERIAAADGAAFGMVRALAYARGRGMPRTGGIWVDAARAVSGATGPADGWEDAATRLAGAYITLDAEAGQSTYRLAHQTFVEHFHAGERDGAGHRRIAAALAGRHRGETWLAANYYTVRYVPEHLVADADRVAPDADGLAALVTDPGWLLRAVALLAIDRTVDVVAAARRAAAGEDEGPVEVVERALRRSRTALGRDPGQLAGQLHARLGSHDRPALAGMGAAVAGIVGEPWLRMVDGGLDWRSDLETRNTFTGQVRGLAFGDVDGRPVVAIAVEQRVVLWDPRTGTPDEVGVIDLVDHRPTAVAVATIDDRPVVVTSSAYDALVEVWDARSGARVAGTTAGLGHALAVGKVGDRRVIAGTNGGELVLLDVRTLEPVEPVDELRRRAVRGFAVRDGALVALCLAPAFGIVAVDAATGAELWQGMDLDRTTGSVDVAVGADLGADFVVVAGVGRYTYWLTGGIGHVAERTDGVRLRAAAIGSIEGRAVVASAPDYDGTALIDLQQAERKVSPEGKVVYSPRTVMRVVKPRSAFERDPLPAGFSLPEPARVDRYSVDRPEEWPRTAAAAGTLDGRPVVVTGSVEGAVWVWDVGGDAPRAVAGPFAEVSSHVLEHGWMSFGAKPGVPCATSVALGEHSTLGPIVAVACAGRVRTYTLPDGHPVETPTEGTKVIDVVDLGRLGRRDVLVTGSKGGVLGLWALAPPGRIAALTLDAPITDVRVDATGERLWARAGDVFGFELAEP